MAERGIHRILLMHTKQRLSVNLLPEFSGIPDDCHVNVNAKYLRQTNIYSDESKQRTKMST